MRRIVIPRPGGPEVLRIEDGVLPPPNANEVRIAVRACGINFADILARQGIYPDCPPYPCVVGYEASGTVVALGADADISLQDKDVFALTDFGGYAEQVNVAAERVWLKPEQLSFEEACAVPLNYITAWALLVALGGLSADETVLIHNAGGGVGLAALDIALHIGAHTLGTASEGKHGFLKRRGLDRAIDYTTRDWSHEVREITGGRGVELILDPMGGSHWKKSYRALRATGRLGMYGIASASGSGLRGKIGLLKIYAGAPLFHPGSLIPGNKGVFGLNIHAMLHEGGKFRLWMEQILKGVAEGWVRPHVDTAFRFDQAADAHRHIEARRNIGKVLLIP